MKKLLLAALAAAVCTTGFAKTADELRIYINPGHGSWTGNDRPNPIVGHDEYTRYGTDTLSFFESNTNLRKGFGVLEKLRVMGLKFDPTLNQDGERHMIGAARDMSNNIVMSHVKCGPYHDDNGTANQLGDATPKDIEWYNRNLTEISAEVDANNFDMFISIHSNAATEGTTTNYPLFLYRGYDTPTDDEGVTLDHQATSRAMADACWSYAIENPMGQWTSYKTSKNLRGDINFYGSSSTSSRTGAKGYLGVLKHHCPGFLVEGYFHTYQPARHRAMNFDVDYIEGAAYAHGIADYFGLTKETTGDLYGVVRDLDETFVDKYYKPNPITADKYLPLNTTKVILSKGSEKVAEYETDEYYNGAFVFKNLEPGTYTVTFDNADYVCDDVEYTVEVKAAQTAYLPECALRSKSWVAPPVVYTDYPDEFVTKAFGPREDFNFASTPVEVALAEGYTIRRSVLYGDNLYVLMLNAEGAAKLYSINVADGSAAELAVPATKPAPVSAAKAERLLALSDIAVTADGVLLGTNLAETSYAGNGEVTIYRWNEGQPAVWFTSKAAGNWNNAYTGQTLMYQGTTIDGYAYFTSETTGSSRNTRLDRVPVIGGEPAAFEFSKPGSSTTPLNVTALGDHYLIHLSPADSKSVVFSSENLPLTEYAFVPGAFVEECTAVPAELATPMVDVDFFKYAGATYVAVPVVENGQRTGISLLNASAGLDKATAVATAGIDATATDGVAALNGRTVVSRDLEENITGGYVDLFYLTAEGKLAKATTQDQAQTKYRAEYAYDLQLTDSENEVVITFATTGDVVDSTVKFTNAETGETLEVPAGPVAKGETASVTVAKGDIPGTCTWAVEVQSHAIPEASAIYTPSRSYDAGPNGGVVIITDPEYDTFGYKVVAHGKANGFDLYDRDNKLLGNYHKGAPFQSINTSSAFRGDELRGRAVFADWSDGNAGYWIVDPANIETAPVNMCVGTKDGTGAYTVNGKIVSGGSSCVAFQGKGTDTKMYTFEEDLAWVAPNGDNILVRYTIGESDQLTMAPDFDFNRNYSEASYFANTNVDVHTTDDGLFVSQVRGTGNNAKGCPGFLYLDNDGNILLNSADIDGLNSVSAGIALSLDKKTLAVSTYENIYIYNVKWNGKVPSVEFQYEIPLSETVWAQLKFDPAGNLHGFLRNRGYRIYSLVNAAPKATTAAKAEFAVTGMGSGVEAIETEAEAAAPATFFNLQGMQVSADALVPGIYVKVSGKKAEKVVIK